jgi:hypothetical protein
MSLGSYRFGIGSILAGILGLMISGGLAADRNKRAEEKKLEELDQLSKRLNRLASDPELSEEQRFLNDRVGELMKRAREAPGDSYLFGRLEEAIDDLLDAGEELRDSRRAGNGDDDDKDRARERTARDLEQTYFRVQQGDYFAKQSGDPRARDYVRTSQRLYQQARAAYDAQEYRRSRHFADAAEEVIAGLENLAQAAVRIPDPPKL